ncbi:hypothetical protein FBBAL38_03805 [Flavobacteria bacterium BAL38]|nr:hypothetical protein FBBAL38_03805 [Flavobacteria bacterium BAL38]
MQAEKVRNKKNKNGFFILLNLK